MVEFARFWHRIRFLLQRPSNSLVEKAMSSAPQELNQALIADEPKTNTTTTELARPNSGLESFLEAFLQERNIRWMLGIGVLILLGSSLMFVTKNWDAMNTIWQYAVLLGYTGLIHVSCLLYTSPSPRDLSTSRMPSSA